MIVPSVVVAENCIEQSAMTEMFKSRFKAKACAIS